MLRILILTCLIGSIACAQSSTIGSINGTSAGTTIKATTVSSKGNKSKSSEGSSKDLWYGKESKVDDVMGCAWPEDFQQRFRFCADRTGLANVFEMDGKNGAEFGILDKAITTQYLEKCSNGDCASAKVNRSHLIDRADLWWSHMDNISSFHDCLKKNTEGMVRLCGSNDQVSQTVSGIAGLHLNMIQILITMHKRVIALHQNHTDACMAKLSEAIHFTAASYLNSNFYAKNQVQCWDVTKGECTNPMCKQFVYVLTCLQSVCPVNQVDSNKFGIWEWYLTDVAKSKRVCSVQADDAQCQSDTAAVLSKTSSDSSSANDLLKKPKEIIEKVKVKLEEFAHVVEERTHMKFYQVALIALGSLVVFIGLVSALCMWYHGLLCQRRQRRVLRYSKLVPEDRLGRREEECKSLTRDYDDVE